MSALDSLRSQEAHRIASLVADGGLVLVHGPDAQEAAEVTAAAAAVDGISVGEVDLDSCGDDRAVARSIAWAAADALLGDARLADIPDDRRSPLQQRSWLDIRRAFSDLSRLFDGGWPADHEPAQVVASVMTSLGRAADDRAIRPALVVYAIDALADVPRSRFTSSREILWALRSAAQSALRVSLVFSGGPAAIEMIGEPDAAFFGWGRPLELTRLDVGTVTDAIRDDLGVDRALAFRAAEFSEGLPRVARLLSRWLRVELADPTVVDPIGAAWTRLLDDQASSLRTTTRLLADLNRVALPVCQALAAGRAPYSAAHSGEVTRALKLLRVHGICESPKPRSWRLTDPLLAAWLRSDSTQARHLRHSSVASSGSP
jgi:hypothetical protein